MKVRIIKGNKKLPKTTYILNMGSATDCPSLKLGLCQAGKACYAMKAEKQYPACLPARRNDEKAWNALPANEIALQLCKASQRANDAGKMEQFRFSESGDFRTQKDVDKMASLCALLSDYGVDCYGYTARTDLNLSGLLKVASVNISNDKSNWQKHGGNRFKMVNEATGNNFVCSGDCRGCNLCIVKRGKTIEVIKH